MFFLTKSGESSSEEDEQSEVKNEDFLYFKIRELQGTDLYLEGNDSFGLVDIHHSR